MIRATLIALGLLVGPLAAQERLSGPEFADLATGKTLTFTRDGILYGREQYFDGNRVLWRYRDGECLSGRWFAEGESLCFVYEDNPVPQCWHLERRGERLVARLDDRPRGDPGELLLSQISEAPLVCEGPDLGV